MVIDQHMKNDDALCMYVFEEVKYFSLADCNVKTYSMWKIDPGGILSV